jgi:hypothetical protein
MSTPLLYVVDDFYRDPDRVRTMGLAAEWIPREKKGEGFPGLESKKCYFNDDIIKLFEGLVGSPIDANPRSLSFGVFRLIPNEPGAVPKVHFDQSDWTGIVYLVPDDLASGGTSVFRHRRTGLEHVPGEGELQELGYSDRADFFERFLKPIQGEPEEWETTASVAMRYNRLLLLRSRDAFHAAQSFFGSTVSTARLTQLFFFNEIPV